MINPKIPNLAQAIYESYRDQVNRTKSEVLVEWRWAGVDVHRLWERVAEDALKHLGLSAT